MVTSVDEPAVGRGEEKKLGETFYAFNSLPENRICYTTVSSQNCFLKAELFRIVHWCQLLRCGSGTKTNSELKFEVK